MFKYRRRVYWQILLLCKVSLWHCKGQSCSEREGVRKDRLVGNFHLVKDTLTNWRILLELCKLLFLRHCYNVSKQNFFNLMETEINKWENATMLYKNISCHLCLWPSTRPDKKFISCHFMIIYFCHIFWVFYRVEVVKLLTILKKELSWEMPSSKGFEGRLH